MTTTPVGMRCPECSKDRTKVVRMRSVSTVPRVTYALIAINVAVFLAEGSGSLSASGSASGTLIREGALLGSSPLPQLAGEGVAHGQWWRLISSGFLHENLLHIGFNMWVLYYLGTMLEPAVGRVRFALIYGVSLLCGSLGALIVSPHSLTVGASGAVFGVMGAAAVESRSRQIPLSESGLGGLIVINLVFSFLAPGVSWGGHLGGFIGGGLAALVIQLADRRRAPALAYVGCVVLAAAAFAASVATSKSSEVEPIGSGPPLTFETPEP